MKLLGNIVIILLFSSSMLSAWPSWFAARPTKANNVKKVASQKTASKKPAASSKAPPKNIKLTAKEPEKIIPSCVVRVLLAEKGSDCNWTLYSKKAFYISDPLQPNKTILTTLDAINIRGKNKV